MKHIKTFESYANSIGEGLTAMKMKKVIEAVAQSLAGQLSDEGIEPDEVQGFLEKNLLMHTLDGAIVDGDPNCFRGNCCAICDY